MLTMEEIRNNPSLITTEFIAQLHDPVSVKRTAFTKACDACDNELEARRENLRKQADVLNTQAKQLSTERDALALQITETTSRGDLDTAAMLDSELERIEAKINTTKRKARLADAAQIKGDPNMLEQVRKAMSELCAVCNEQVGTVNELRQICQQQIDYFTHLLTKELKYAEERTYYEHNRLEKIEKVFNDNSARRAAIEAKHMAVETAKLKSEVHVFAP